MYQVEETLKNLYEFSTEIPTRDGWIKEFIKRKLSSGLFWAVGAEEKKTPKCHKYAIFF